MTNKEWLEMTTEADTLAVDGLLDIIGIRDDDSNTVGIALVGPVHTYLEVIGVGS